MNGQTFTVRGQVQGVGFRPTVWRLAAELGLAGDVRNTGDGVEIRVWGADLEAFADRLRAEAPALARIDSIDSAPINSPAPTGFAIAASAGGRVRATVTPDAATCPECLAEVRDPSAHRYGYAFANCTNCGPRFSIVQDAPYDRDKTTMRAFALCPACRGEYEDPADRRFHAQPIACHRCGPQAWIEDLGRRSDGPRTGSQHDAVDLAGRLLMLGHIVAIKGVGGFHLACDATRADVVARLRARKRRRTKAFALMARDLEVIRRHCAVSDEEAVQLQSPAAPIVLLEAVGAPLPEAVAPGLDRLGFMLPYTPLHHLLLRQVDRPVVMTSGNMSGRPQCIDNGAARAELAAVADYALMHDREIANRIDDSVVRVDLGRRRMLRRARGYAPAPIALPEGFPSNALVLAMGGELKNSFCLIRGGQAILSQHMGDLEDAATADDVAHNLALYRRLFRHAPHLVAVDRHPDYISTKHGRDIADEAGVPVAEIQHHHAHVAACMAENGWPLDGGSVLGVALDGLGHGDDGTVWGGEFLTCDYRGYRRLASLKPVALPGGAAAIREPWRNAYAHLMAAMTWDELVADFAALEIVERLASTPRATLDAMIAKDINAPLSSSCGRLFDAAAALAGLAWDAQSYEGEAAMRLESVVDRAELQDAPDRAYRFSIRVPDDGRLPHIDAGPAWRALLADLHRICRPGVIAARFHRGLSEAVVTMAERCAAVDRERTTIALTGGCFQNRTLFTLVHEGLEARGFRVLSHEKLPANDGGLALGQAVVALARRQGRSRIAPCV